MRVFFDTNVLISAFVARGLCADLLRIAITEYELIIGEFVLDEFARKLEKKLKFPKDEIVAMVAFLRQFEVVPVPDAPFEIQCPDKDDCWVIASAIAGKSRLLVTGDSDLLDLPRMLKLKILSPRNFLELHQKRTLK